MAKASHLVLKERQGRPINSSLRRCPSISNTGIRSLSNNRHHRRLRYAAKIIFGTQHGSFRGLLRDLSRSGAFIETRGAVPVGARVLATIPFRNKVGWVSVAGKVVRADAGGIGLRFVH